MQDLAIVRTESVLGPKIEAKLKVLDAQKVYNNVVTKQNGFKDNVNNLENSLKTARKKESKQIEYAS